MEPKMRGALSESTVNSKSKVVEVPSKAREDEKELMPLEL
jgi:hypothetical protein